MNLFKRWRMRRILSKIAGLQYRECTARNQAAALSAQCRTEFDVLAREAWAEADVLAGKIERLKMKALGVKS